MTSRAALGFVLVALAAGCGRSGVTEERLERSASATFANLVSVQTQILGGKPVDAKALAATARCQKVGIANATNDTRGAGTWRCTITWFVPGHAAPVRDTYEIAVATDGCYTATADGAEAHVGGPTLKTLSGSIVTNLVYAFDGCFDTSS